MASVVASARDPATDPVLAEVVDRLVRRFAPRRIMLFGSRAWGQPDDGSDYDLLVLVDQADDVRRLAGEMRWTLLGLQASFDILVRTAGWWADWCQTPFSFEHRIELDGTELYAAA